MAFSDPVVVGSNQNRSTAGTSIAATIDEIVPAGTLVVVQSSWDNEGTTDAETTQLAISDTKSQVWTLIREQTNSEGVAAQDGITMAAWYTVLSSAYDPGDFDEVAIVSDSSRTARCITVIAVEIDQTNAVLTTTTASGLFSGGDRTRTITGLDAGTNYLLLGFYGVERRFGDYPTNTEANGAFNGRALEDSAYLSCEPIGTDSSSSAANISQRISWRETSGITSDDWTLTNCGTGDSITWLSAFEEDGTLPERFIAVAGTISVTGTANVVQNEVTFAVASTIDVSGAVAGFTVSDATPRVMVWDGAAWV